MTDTAADIRTPRSAALLRSLVELLPAIALAALVLVLWEAVIRLFKVSTFILPAPSAIFVSLVENRAALAAASQATALEVLFGFVLAAVTGIAVALVIVRFERFGKALYPLIVLFQNVPKVALAPLFVIWLGPDIKSKVSVAFTIAIFPIVIDTALGLRSVEPEVLNMAKVMRASQWEILRRIRFQHALPSLFAGMKVAVSLALVGAIVGEFVAGGTGLGSAILAAQGAFDTPQVFACIVLLGFVGTALFYAMDALECWLIPWHSSQRAS